MIKNPMNVLLAFSVIILFVAILYPIKDFKTQKKESELLDENSKGSHSFKDPLRSSSGTSNSKRINIDERFRKIVETDEALLNETERENLKYAKEVMKKVAGITLAEHDPIPEDIQKTLIPLVLQAYVKRQEQLYSTGKLTKDGDVLVQLTGDMILDSRNESNNYIWENAQHLLSEKQLTALISSQYAEMTEDLKVKLPGALMEIGGVTEADLAKGKLVSPALIIKKVPGLPLNQ